MKHRSSKAARNNRYRLQGITQDKLSALNNNLSLQRMQRYQAPSIVRAFLPLIDMLANRFKEFSRTVSVVVEGVNAGELVLLSVTEPGANKINAERIAEFMKSKRQPDSVEHVGAGASRTTTVRAAGEGDYHDPELRQHLFAGHDPVIRDTWNKIKNPIVKKE